MKYSSPTVYSSRTRVHIFKDSDSDSSPFVRTQTRTPNRTRAIRTQTRTQTAHWDSIFKKIQWTFSIYFLNSNYLVSYSISVWPGTVGQSVALSRLYSTHVINWHRTHWLYPQLLHAIWTCVHQWRNVHVATRTGQDSRTSWSYDLVCLKCNVNML